MPTLLPPEEVPPARQLVVDLELTRLPETPSEGTLNVATLAEADEVSVAAFDETDELSKVALSSEVLTEAALCCVDAVWFVDM
ncbi:MAG: hypothetical protein LC685_00465 [Actinobacteria bacterium]|nr:hypothetical protein [Actinomycetota bacterium]